MSQTILYAGVVPPLLECFLRWDFKLRHQSNSFLNEFLSMEDMKPLYCLKIHLYLVGMPPLKVYSSFPIR